MLNKINTFLSKRQQILYLLLVIGSFIGALLEFIGIGSIPIFIDFLVNDGEKRLFNINLDNLVSINSNTNKVLFGSIILSLIFIFKNLYFTLLYFFQGSLFKEIKRANSLKLYNQYIQSPYELHLNLNPALINRNLLSEVIVSTNYLENLLMIIREALIALLIIILLLLVNTYISLITIVLIIAIAAAFYLAIKKIVKRLSVLTQKFRAEQIKNINHVFGSIKESKILNADELFKKEFKNFTGTIETNNFYINFTQKMPKLIIEVLVIISLTLVITIFAADGKNIVDYLPILSLFAVGTIRLLPSFNLITSNLTRLKSESISFNYIVNEFKKEENNEGIKQVQIKSENLPFKSFESTIDLKDVSYKYQGKHENVLEKINLQIKKGQMIGLIGESGQGKTTLINLLIGLLNPNSGKIVFDGKNINDHIKNWRALIGFIPQDIYLLDDTIRKNIAFGISEKEINEKKIIEAVEKSELSNFLKKLPNGLDTIVGDRGVRISGGQRQRIGIARSLYRNPEILILDEATSSLDIETENKFIENINRFKSEKTVIISTHKFEILKECDIIYKIKDKNIIKK